MPTITLKKADLNDLTSIQQLGQQTFMETFASENTPENIAQYLEKSFNTAQLTSELQNPESQFYLAFWDDLPIGYLKINFGQSQTEVIDEKALEVQRIYVLKEYHGKKIGQLFIDQVFKIVRQKPVTFIWLGVWEQNHRAIAFYTKNGFSTFDTHVFTVGNDKQTDLLMKHTIV